MLFENIDMLNHRDQIIVVYSQAVKIQAVHLFQVKVGDWK